MAHYDDFEEVDYEPNENDVREDEDERDDSIGELLYPNVEDDESGFFHQKEYDS